MLKLAKFSDIRDVNDGIIIHQVNCRGVMGAGVAKAIRNKWPRVYIEYKRLCDSQPAEMLLGKAQAVPVSERVIVVNLFSQLDFGRDPDRVYTEEQKLVDGIQKVCQQYPDRRVFIPRGIGCGPGGSKWYQIEPQLEGIENLYAVASRKHGRS